MAHADNQQVIANGQITLYLRDDVKTPQWQCRFKIRGHSGYVRRSTGESDLDRAKEVSLQILGELNQRVTQNLPLKRKTFSEIAAAFLKDAETRWKEGRNSEGRYVLIKGTVQRYLVPYFGNRDITLIQKKDLMAYRAWRQAYWVTGPGFEEIGKTKKPPTQATLKQEWTVLRGVLLHGVDLGIVHGLRIGVVPRDRRDFAIDHPRKRGLNGLHIGRGEREGNRSGLLDLVIPRSDKFEHCGTLDCTIKVARFRRGLGGLCGQGRSGEAQGCACDHKDRTERHQHCLPSS